MKPSMERWAAAVGPGTGAGVKRWLAWIFAGSHGLRAGWGVLLFLVLVGAVQIAMVFVLTAMGIGQDDLARDPRTPAGTMATTALGLISVVAATGLMALIERRRLSDYFLGRRGLALRFGQGALTGLVLMAALAGALLLLGALSFDGVALDAAQAWRLGLQWAAAWLMVALLEELSLRGYMLSKLARGIGFRWAAIATSLIFATAHLLNPGESIIGLVSVVLIGLVFAFSVWKTGSLWWAIGFHTAWNWAQSYLFGVGNSGFVSEGSLLITHPQGPAWLSGGPTGPEGSALNLAVIVAAAALVHWGLKRRREDGEDRGPGIT